MVAPWVIPAAMSAVSAIASIWGASASAKAANREADRATSYAGNNAANMLLWGEQQAALSMGAARTNAELLKQQAHFNILQTRQATDFNVSAIRIVNEYNSLLADEDLRQMYQAHGLEEYYLHTDFAIAKGAAIAKQSASGTVIGEGSNQAVINNLAHQTAIANLVLDTQAYENAIGIQNAVAKGNWEASMAIQKVLFDGEQQNMATAYSAMIGGQSAMVEASVNGTLGKMSADNRAAELLNVGAQQSSAQNTQASMYWVRGLTSAAGSAAQGIGNSLLASK